jgi:hypothetical protein
MTDPITRKATEQPNVHAMNSGMVIGGIGERRLFMVVLLRRSAVA